MFRWGNRTSHLGRMKNSSYYISPVGDRTHDLPHTVASNMVKVSHALNHSATVQSRVERTRVCIFLICVVRTKIYALCAGNVDNHIWQALAESIVRTKISSTYTILQPTCAGVPWYLSRDDGRTFCLAITLNHLNMRQVRGSIYTPRKDSEVWYMESKHSSVFTYDIFNCLPPVSGGSI